MAVRLGKCYFPGCQDPAHNYFCEPHNDAWLESGEYKRVGGSSVVDAAMMAVAIGDFIRRIEAEKRNYGNEEKK